VFLRTPGGVLRVDLWLVARIREFGNYEDAVVRLRGCLFVARDIVANQTGAWGTFTCGLTPSWWTGLRWRINFPRRKARGGTELFDPQASAFQRVKVSGQILHMKGRDYYMVDGTNGVRFNLEAAGRTAYRDLVEVVGYPELSGSRAAFAPDDGAKKPDMPPWPKPKNLSPDDLPGAIYDSTRVRIEGWLVSSRRRPLMRCWKSRPGHGGFGARRM